MAKLTLITVLVGLLIIIDVTQGKVSPIWYFICLNNDYFY